MIKKSELKRRKVSDFTFLDNLNIPLILKKIYVQRGINNIHELDLNLRKLLSYRKLTGIIQARDYLINALSNQKKIFIIGDFDTDGATSIALAVLSLRKMGAHFVNFIVPNRFDDGYGLSDKIVNLAESRGAEIIITVDNGISSYSGVELARQKGISVIITDHHIPNNTLPNANAIVNPNLDICKFESKALSGVGVVFYLMSALCSQLKKIGWFDKHNIIVPKLSDFLDLVALGTVADLVPLDNNNRILVYQGIYRIRSGRCRLGIRFLMDIARRNISKLQSNDLAFVIGPRINAAGRLEDMSIGVQLLLENNPVKVHILAIKLNSLNILRKEIEKKMEITALNQCKKIQIKKNNTISCLTIFHIKWHEGIIGIIASKMKERFYLPVIAFAQSEIGILKGSGRSIEGLHMFNILNCLDISYPGIMIRFGGHAMAVGLTLMQSNFNKFCQYFSELVSKNFDPLIFHHIIWSDGELSKEDLSLDTAELLYNSGPWGQSFPAPVFDGKFYILDYTIIQKKYLKFKLQSLTGGPILDGISFNIDIEWWLKNKTCIVQLAYKLNVNEFNRKRTIQLLIHYIWPIVSK